MFLANDNHFSNNASLSKTLITVCANKAVKTVAETVEAKELVP